MGGITDKDSRIEVPLLAGKLVRGFTPQAPESFAVVKGQQKNLHMVVELGRGLVMIALHGGPFERAVEALDLSVGPGVGRLGETVFGAVFVAHAVKNVPPGVDLVGHIAKPSTVVGRYFGCLMGDSGQHPAQKIGRQYFRGARLQPGESQLAGAVDGHKGIDAPFFGVDSGEINVQVAHGVVLELLSLLCGRGGRQAAGAVALEQAVQGRAGKGRNGLLQGVGAVIQGRQGGVGGRPRPWRLPRP